MNNSFNHFFSSCNGSSTQPKLYVSDTQTQVSFGEVNYSSSLSQFYEHSQGMISNDKGICEGMINCHLTDAWSSLMHPPFRYPVTHVLNKTPILGSYLTRNVSTLTQTYPSGFTNGACHEQVKSNYVNPLIKPHRQPIQERQLNRAELNCEQSLDNNDDPIRRQYFVCTTSVNEQSEKITTSIKYQDRNKKLDFKVNFRDENRKVNGCFHRDDKQPSSDASVPPPKKKWIRHYMSGKPLIFLWLNRTEVIRSPSSFELVRG